MIVRKLKNEFLDRSVMPEEVQALVASAFEKGAFAMAGAILANSNKLRKLDNFLGKIQMELDLYCEENPCDIFVPITGTLAEPKAVFADDPMWFDPHNGEVGGQYSGLTDYNSTVHGTLRIRYGGVYDGDYYFIIDSYGREWGVKKIAIFQEFKNAPNSDVTEVEYEPAMSGTSIWFPPSLAYCSQEVIGAMNSGETVRGVLHNDLGGFYIKSLEDGEVGLIVNGIVKICKVEDYVNPSNAEEFWFIPSLAYFGKEVVGLSPSGQNVFGGKLYQNPITNVWYVKGQDEETGVDVIRIAIPEVYKKMLEIKDAKDLRDEK